MEKQEFQEIMVRYFRGQLNESEYELLTDFLQDPSYGEYFELAKQEWNKNPQMDEAVKRNWSRLQYNINKPDSETVKIPVTRQLWFQLSAIAAVLVFGLLVGGALTFLFSGNNGTSEQFVFETPRGEKSLVKLPDGSEIWLNANSRLVYHSFSSTNRQVELEGEAFFNISHNENAPFVVKTNECEVEVLGTIFNVMAYEEFGRKEITLLNGVVNIHNQGEDHVLKPGQALVIKDQKAQIVEVNASQASGWVDNKFIFQNIPLSELIKRLENWYDIDIVLDNRKGEDISFTGTFKNEETIWQVLDAIKVYLPIEYEKTELRNIKIAVN